MTLVRISDRKPVSQLKNHEIVYLNPTTAGPGAQPRPKLTRAEAARINGAKSKGPISVEGKAKSSRNSLKHGLYAKPHTILSFEHDHEYYAMLNDALNSYRPKDLPARSMVEELTHLQWSLNRARKIETGLIEYEIQKLINGDGDGEVETEEDDTDTADPILLLVKAWFKLAGNANPMDLLCRYTKSLQSQFHSKLRDYVIYEKRAFKAHQNGDDLVVPYTAPEFPKPETRQEQQQEERQHQNTGNEPNVMLDDKEANSPETPCGPSLSVPPASAGEPSKTENPSSFTNKP